MPTQRGQDGYPAKGAGRDQRHRYEQTLLYRIIAMCYPVFPAHLARQGVDLPMSGVCSRITSSVGGWNMGSCG